MVAPKMKIRTLSVTIPCRTLDESTIFYTDELLLFERTELWGDEWTVLQPRYGVPIGIYLWLTEGLEPFLRSEPLISIDVTDLEEEYRRLSSLDFVSGAKMLSSSIFEYPLASFFALEDPGGNVIQIAENRGFATL
jgi:catechol 2,3-dioxygenase-like lactoylglutathione lyase family enzyme